MVSITEKPLKVTENLHLLSIDHTVTGKMFRLVYTVALVSMMPCISTHKFLWHIFDNFIHFVKAEMRETEVLYTFVIFFFCYHFFCFDRTRYKARKTSHLVVTLDFLCPRRIAPPCRQRVSSRRGHTQIDLTQELGRPSWRKESWQRWKSFKCLQAVSCTLENLYRASSPASRNKSINTTQKKNLK